MPDINEPTEATPDLLPCPFCGNAASARPIRDPQAYLPIAEHIVVCECGASGPNCANRNLAIAAWNRRVSSAPSFADGIEAAAKYAAKLRDDSRLEPMEFSEIAKGIRALAHNPQASIGGDPWNVDRLAGRWKAPHFDGETQVPAGQNLTLGQMAAILVGSGLTVEPRPRPTHRHKKRGTEYVLLFYGRMQAADWFDHGGSSRQGGYPGVGMRKVAIYRSATDPTEIWVRPREEFEDGRFEVLK